MTEEEKKEIYKKAFEYAKNDFNINKTILTRIQLFEKRHSFLGDYVNYPSNDNQIASFLEKNSELQKILKDATNEKVERDKIFKILQELINENKGVKDQIGQLQRNRGILIVGNDRDLIDGIVANLWYTFPQNIPLTLPSNLLWQKINDSIGKYVTWRVGFWYENYTGWDEKNIKVRLLENQKDKMSLLFLRGLNGCLDILRGLVESVRDNRERGTLIINITRTNDLPHEFLDQFEPIYLEPEKQGRSVSIQQTKAENVFRWCYGTWEITFEGQTIRPSDSYGLRYIHCLLANPSKKIHVSELMKAIPREQKSQLLLEKGEKIEFEDELNGSTADDSVDEASLKQYKEQLAELSGDIKQAEESGNSMELEELRKEFNGITDYLKTVTGKKGRPRKLLDQSENQRQAVKNCIIDAFAAIKKEYAPLYRHFKVEKTIKLGLDCSYDPPKATSWVTR